MGYVYHHIKLSYVYQGRFHLSKWLFARLPHLKMYEVAIRHLPHIKCIRLGSVHSSYLPFKMHYVRSSLLMLWLVNSHGLHLFELIQWYARIAFFGDIQRID